MRVSGFRHVVLSVCVTAWLCAGCGGEKVDVAGDMVAEVAVLDLVAEVAVDLVLPEDSGIEVDSGGNDGGIDVQLNDWMPEVDVVEDLAGEWDEWEEVLDIAPEKYVCVPDCEGIACGENGCGGSCGECEGQDECQEGQCVCIPACVAKECGDDGCDGSCGTCQEPLWCVADKCVECDDGNDQWWDGCTEGVISEFLVNFWTDDDQAHPDLAVFPDGSFLITWDGVGAGDDKGVFARRFSADGVALGGDFAVNEHTEGDQEYCRVAALADGGFVVVWGGTGPDDNHGVFGRIFTAQGVAAGPQFTMNSELPGEQSHPWVVGLAGGGFAAAWTGFGALTGNHDVMLRIFDAQGQAAAEEFKANVYTDNDQGLPSMAGWADGRFVVTWQSKPQDSSGYGVISRFFGPDGVAQSDEIQVNTTTSGNQWTPWVSSHPAGLVVVWDGEGTEDEWGISGRRLDLAGEMVGEEFQVNEIVQGEQWEASVAAFPDGSFVVVWETWLEKEFEGEVFMRRYGADGETLTGPAQINLETWDGQGDPSVAATPDGGFIVTWYSFLQDGSERGIFALRFDSDGKKLIH